MPIELQDALSASRVISFVLWVICLLALIPILLAGGGWYWGTLIVFSFGVSGLVPWVAARDIRRAIWIVRHTEPVDRQITLTEEQEPVVATILPRETGQEAARYQILQPPYIPVALYRAENLEVRVHYDPKANGPIVILTSLGCLIGVPHKRTDAI